MPALLRSGTRNGYRPVLCPRGQVLGEAKGTKCENKRTIVDDTVIWSDSVEENFNDVCKLLTVCVIICDMFQIFSHFKYSST